ncbi:MAG: efflux RND transporter periplasmic adaptor subunit [Treponema sp.]|jgi:HlyD family secretion protein|nr:efflux RND transporter periplasmic adaptor subunit [Treponema sp.]
MHIIKVLTICSIAFLAGTCKPLLDQFGKTRNKATAYEYAIIKRGTIEKTVSSSGTLEPVATVKALPRMSGKVERVFVDYNDSIHKGQILAELNTDMLKLQREQQAAQVLKARANYNLQLINYQNLERLAEKSLISEYELKSGKTTLDIQKADLSVAESNLRSIETEINQYAYITSPIDGIVLERTVNEGDTVVDSSSGNSSAIFTLAENLEEMRIKAWVGELDIASIYEGQEVRFTLESLPGKNFSGMVESKRLMPSVQDGVVSYNIVISVENKDGSLLPGMTCSVEFIEERRENILLVPNAALRYQPTALSEAEISDMIFNATISSMSEEQKALALERRRQNATNASAGGGDQAAQAPNQRNGLTGLMQGGGTRAQRMPPPIPGGAAQSGGAGRQPSGQMKTLWFIDEHNKFSCVMVQAGASDGSYTEVRMAGGENEGDLEEKRVIVRERIAGLASGNSAGGSSGSRASSSGARGDGGGG